MIDVTVICPRCDKRNVLSFTDDHKGDDFPDEEQPWWVLCKECGCSDSMGLYEFVCGELMGAGLEDSGWGECLLTSEKYVFGDFDNLPLISTDEYMELWEGEPYLPIPSCLFAIRPGHFLYAWSIDGFINCRFYTYDSDLKACVHFPRQLVYDQATKVMGAENVDGTDIDINHPDTREDIARISQLLASCILLLRKQDTCKRWVAHDLANEEMEAKGQPIPLFAFWSVTYPGYLL